MAKIVIKCTDQANEEQFKKKTEDFFKDKKGTVEVRKSAPNSFKIVSREEFQKNYKAWLEYLSKFNIDISQIQLVKEEESLKTSLSMRRMTSKVDRVKTGITFESLNNDFEEYKKKSPTKPIKPPRKSTEVSSLWPHSSTESLSSTSSNETVTSVEHVPSSITSKSVSERLILTIELRLFCKFCFTS